MNSTSLPRGPTGRGRRTSLQRTRESGPGLCPTLAVVAIGVDEQSPCDTDAAVLIDPSVLDLRIDSAWIREDLPVRYSVGLDAAAARLTTG